LAVGLVSEKITRPATITTGELLALVDSPNRNPAIDAILVRMPLPGHTDAQRARGRVFSGCRAAAVGLAGRNGLEVMGCDRRMGTFLSNAFRMAGGEGESGRWWRGRPIVIGGKNLEVV